MIVQPKEEILINGVWYRPGDVLPKEEILTEKVKDASINKKA